MSTIKDGITEAELALLSINQRNALVAHVFNHNPYEAIAVYYDIPLGTVKRRINRARAKIERARADALLYAREASNG